MQTYFLFLTILFFLTSSLTTLNAQDNWTLALDKEGVKVYTGIAQDNNLKPIKAIINVNASVAKLEAILRQPSNFKKYSYECIEAYLLEQKSENELYAYTATHAPWPVKDRDNVTLLKFNYLENGGLKVVIKDFPKKIPEKKDFVRIPFLEGSWSFTPLGENVTQIEYRLNTNPGGSIPIWLSNMFVIDAPFYSLTKLKALAEGN